MKKKSNRIEIVHDKKYEVSSIDRYDTFLEYYSTGVRGREIMIVNQSRIQSVEILSDIAIKLAKDFDKVKEVKELIS